MLSTRRLSRLTIAATLILVTVGGFTRGGGSGYGCRDRWPLCDNGLLGGLLPRAEYHMVVEWSHRWVASIVGALALATAVSAWRRHRYQPVIIVPAMAAVVMIAVQAWVGRLVVKRDLDADLVSVHLAISMMIAAFLVMVVVATLPAAHGPAPVGEANRGWAMRLGIAAAGSYTLLLLGSYVHNLYISGWPLIGDTVIPNLSNRLVTVHFLHRTLAGVGLVYLISLAVYAARQHRPHAERLLLNSALVAYAVNVGLGAAHVFTKVDSSVLVAAHLLMAALVWTALIGATMIARIGVAQSGSDYPPDTRASAPRGISTSLSRSSSQPSGR